MSKGRIGREEGMDCRGTESSRQIETKKRCLTLSEKYFLLTGESETGREIHYTQPGRHCTLCSAQWVRTANNRDVSIGPFARPLACLLTRSLALGMA